jgi:hypothetical protein
MSEANEKPDSLICHDRVYSVVATLAVARNFPLRDWLTRSRAAPYGAVSKLRVVFRELRFPKQYFYVM